MPTAPPSTAIDLKAAAIAARLRYVSDAKPGITRVRAQAGFGYRYPDGSKVTDEETLMRIRKLAIPPATRMYGSAPIGTGICRQ